ncbi:hypothetical protein U4960_03885 [Altererythrobacter sp. H2]|uniref:hypothetical protein n=1 Tax=Altererythrobacter sp. H2 TaxID=3108391 RepID=UPI002B4C1EBB|nr:hypothetical protein [Altererythrobacter sp. H2]WRK96478.1 hypothetical protein U4960_03885 [Altererythrobacter sp. H2]
MAYANEHRVRAVIALFGLLAMVLSGLHAGPVAAHESDGTHWSDVASHGHGHGEHNGGGGDDPNDSPADLDADQGHHHCPSAAAPQLPQAELNSHLSKQILFAAEVSFLRLGAAAPPLDPPKA